MKTRDLDTRPAPTKLVFQRRNGTLKILSVPVETKSTAKPKPMFPISKDRNEQN